MNGRIPCLCNIVSKKKGGFIIRSTLSSSPTARLHSIFPELFHLIIHVSPSISLMRQADDLHRHYIGTMASSAATMLGKAIQGSK